MDAVEVANRFNTFFSEKIANIRNNLDNQKPVVMDDNEAINQPPILESFALATESEITNLIVSSPSKTCSLDPIPTSIVKQHVHILTPIITNIVNMSLTDGVFPSIMKSALVTPLLKKSSLDPEQLNNYRPISNLTFLSKLVEKLVSTRITVHMQQNKLSEKFQSAYRENHGTETALLRVQNDILRSLDNHNAVFLVLLDLSAAFDTIDHEILCERLRNNIGISGTALAWIKSYLTDRHQSVCIDKSLSSSIRLKYGVPQGSVLGPRFFTVYSAPIADIVRRHNLQVHMYADDTQLYLTFKPNIPCQETSALQQVRTCVADISRWMTKNKLKLNPDKTEFLIIATNQQRSKIGTTEVQLVDSVIPATTSARNLGVYLDQAMNMDAHVSSVCKSATYHLRNINSIRNVLTYQTTETLVHAFITSRLDNGNSLLYGITEKSLDKLQYVQNAAARLVVKVEKRHHITPILKDLHWLPIRKRIEFKILLLTWKCLNNNAPDYLQELLLTYDPCRRLRSVDKLLLQIPRSNLRSCGDRAFSVVAPRLWNQLPVHIKSIQSINDFKQKLKTHLFTSAFEN
jgi:hypothetical protein